MIYTSRYPSPVGQLLLAAQDNALTGLWIEHQKYYLGSLEDEQTEQDDYPILKETKAWLDRYFAGKKPAISELKLAPNGSEFRQMVWAVLCQIPYGEVTTYGKIASALARTSGQKRMSAQAVGGAVAHNPISIIIPCHRVVGTDGSLTGYAGGIDKKIWLLAHEGTDMEGLFVPKKSTAP
ncbi:MAG: methylated-DNA--[protein]-cysteine S-methyltransferase [Blautia sp.]|jgi:methylated-DNA-[protein]-cysteine S-methyltransferase